MTMALLQKLLAFSLQSGWFGVAWFPLTAFDKQNDCVCNIVIVLTHDWSMEVGSLVQRVDALNGTRVGALGSIEQEVVSAAGAVGASIGAIVTPGVSA